MPDASSNASLPGLSPAARLALPALLSGATGIAFAPILVRLSAIGPVSTAMWRLALSWPLLWLWMTWEDRKGNRASTSPRKPRALSDWITPGLPGLFIAGDLAIWHVSITLTTVANATLLCNCAPLFVTLFGWILFRFRPSRQFLTGMALAVGGAIILMGESLTFSSGHLPGDGLGVVSAVFYAAYILAVRRLRAAYSTATIMTWSAVSGIIVLLPAALALGERPWPQDLHAWAVLTALAMISHVSGQSLIAYALAYLPATFGSVSLLWQPVCAAVLAWAVLGEPLGPWQACGGMVVLAGIFLARRGSRKARVRGPLTRRDMD